MERVGGKEMSLSDKVHKWMCDNDIATLGQRLAIHKKITEETKEVVEELKKAMFFEDKNTVTWVNKKIDKIFGEKLI